MWNFENEKLNDVHYSRYIASWLNKGGQEFSDEFVDWLKSLGASEDEVSRIKLMATCGKMELEIAATSYIKKEKEAIENYKKLAEEKKTKDKIKNYILDNIENIILFTGIEIVAVLCGIVGFAIGKHDA